MSADVRIRAWGQTVNAQLSMPVVLELSIGRLFHFESGGHEDEPTSNSADVEEIVLGGELAPLAPVAGKWTVFDFWAPWCDACKVLDRQLRELGPNVAIRRVNIVDFDSPIALRELPGASVLPRLRLISPEGAMVFEESGEVGRLMERVRDSIGATYACPMHPEQLSRTPGTCPVCSMTLRRK